MHACFIKIKFNCCKSFLLSMILSCSIIDYMKKVIFHFSSMYPPFNITHVPILVNEGMAWCYCHVWSVTSVLLQLGSAWGRAKCALRQQHAVTMPPHRRFKRNNTVKFNGCTIAVVSTDGSF